MENASKALLMAGAMLIFILIVTFAMYMFQRMALQTSEFYEELSEHEISEFNQKFLNYDDRDDLNIQNVVTIINLAKENNTRGLFPINIVVNLDGTNVVNKNNDEIAELLHDNILNKYSCSITFDSNSKLVNKVEFVLNNTP